MNSKNDLDVGLSTRELAWQAELVDRKHVNWLSRIQCRHCVNCRVSFQRCGNSVMEVGYCVENEIFLTKEDLDTSVYAMCGEVSQS